MNNLNETNRGFLVEDQIWIQISDPEQAHTFFSLRFQYIQK